MNPPLKKVKKNIYIYKKNPVFPLLLCSFLNFSGKYILKTAFTLNQVHVLVHTEKKTRKDFLYIWPAMRGLFLLSNTLSLHGQAFDVLYTKCRNPSEYVYT